VLSDLGVENNLAYTYFEGLKYTVNRKKLDGNGLKKEVETLLTLYT
jgi:hypothetical protein